MTMHVRAGGSWHTVQKVWAKVSGTWREVDVHARASGSWRSIHTIVPPVDYNISTAFITDAQSDRACQAGIRVNPDGSLDQLINGTYSPLNASTDWAIPNGSYSDHDVRITNVSWSAGSAFSSSPGSDGTWFSLASAKEWYVVDTDPNFTGSKIVSFDLEIRDASDTVVATGGIQLTANYNSI